MLHAIIENLATLTEALKSSEAVHWRKAMELEYDTLMKNNTWEIVEKPSNKNVIGCKCVFAVKRNQEGVVERYKARLVANGCAQKVNVDFTDTYAPVVRHSTVRILLALAAKYKLLVNHVDIAAAYLNGELTDEIYMKQPPMFGDKRNSDLVCRIKKSLYGLKQAGREWNKKVTEILLTMGFLRCNADTCVYIKRAGSNINLIGPNVDDMLLACSSEKYMRKIITELNQHVEAVNRGPASFYLGMQIERENARGAISIHQAKYVEHLLEKWNMTSCKASSTPMASGTVLNKCEGECTKAICNEYQSLIGELMYLAVISRPDIAHIIAKLAQFNSHAHQQHFGAAKHVLRYLKGCPKGMITFSPHQENVICFTDADWGSDGTNRKSYSGSVLLLAGGAVAWESKKQQVVALAQWRRSILPCGKGQKRSLFIEACFTNWVLAIWCLDRQRSCAITREHNFWSPIRRHTNVVNTLTYVFTTCELRTITPPPYLFISLF